MIALNLAIWILLVLFFITVAAVLVGTYRGDSLVNTDRPPVLAVIVYAPGTDPASALADVRRQEYPAGMLESVAVAADDGFEEPVRKAAAGSDAELVLVVAADCSIGPQWAAQVAACFVPGVAMVRCYRRGSGTRGLDLALNQAVEAGLAGLGARPLPVQPGFGIRTAVLLSGKFPDKGRIRFTGLKGAVLHERVGEPGAGIAALAAWFRYIGRVSVAGFLIVFTGGGVLAGSIAAAAAGMVNRWQLILAFFYFVLLFGTLLPLYLRGASVAGQSRLLGAVVPHALRRALLSVPAMGAVLFTRPSGRR